MFKHGPNLQDAELTKSAALPNGANTTTTDPIRLHTGAKNTAFVAQCEARISAPALGATPLPDTQTITYSLEHSDSESSGYSTISGTIVQTGAGGAGADANELRIGLPTDVKQYVRAKAVKTGAANASGSSFTLDLLF